MRTISLLRVAIATSCALACSSVAWAETWAYRGRLEDGDRPAQGTYAFRAQLFDAAAGGRPVGAAVMVPGVEIKDGTFAVDFDFGVRLVDAPTLWLELEVAAPKEGFVALGARQRFDAKAALAGVCWDTQGNAAAAGDYLGTTNNLALEFKANALRVARYEPSAISPNVINGTPGNSAAAGVYGAVIGGGGASVDPNLSGEAPNAVFSSYATIGGGMANTVTGTSAWATIGGGNANLVSNTAATVAGGEFNEASGSDSTVGGGTGNFATRFVATVGGGFGNLASGQRSMIAGGSNNTASGDDSMVLGGSRNCAGGFGSFAVGYKAKVRPGNQSGPAGDGCTSVPASTVDALYGDRGAFVWADFTNTDLVSTAPNQFLVRADGGVSFNAQPFSPNADLTVGARAATGDGDVDFYLQSRGGKTTDIYVRDADGMVVFSPSGVTADTHFGLGAGTPVATRYLVTGANGAYLSTAGAWTNASSLAFKHDFHAIDPLEILDKVVELPVMSWQYKGGGEGRHLGPTAEDFQAAFGLNGADTEHIATVDADGVALLAIKGLAARLDHEQAELQQHLERDNAELRAQNSQLQEQIRALASRLDGLQLRIGTGTNN